MTLVKKGTRRIVVDGVTYRWRVRHKLTYCQANGWAPLAFAVEDATIPGTTLVVHTNHPHPGNWFGLTTKPILPADVAQAIRTALARGWTPPASGPPFRLDVSDADQTCEAADFVSGAATLEDERPVALNEQQGRCQRAGPFGRGALQPGEDAFPDVGERAQRVQLHPSPCRSPYASQLHHDDVLQRFDDVTDELMHHDDECAGRSVYGRNFAALATSCW